MSNANRMRAWGIAAAAIAVCGACAGPKDRVGHRDAGAGGGGGQGGGGIAGGGGSGGGGDSDGPPTSDKPKPKRCGVGGTVGFKPTEFMDPVVQCHWGASTNVMSTTLVIDLQGDGKPEIVFPAFDGQIHAISGSDCSDVWAAPYAGICPTCDLAAGDLDGDGKPEIVGDGNTGVTVFSGKDGSVLASIKDTGWVSRGWVGPAIANVDGTGPPEILVASAAYRYEAGKLVTLWARDEDGSSSVSVVDLDGDGVMEMVTNSKVRNALTGELRLDLRKNSGFSAVADFDPASDGPEIIFNDQTYGEVLVLAGLKAASPGKVLFGPYYTEGMGTIGYGGGPPAVADFDGDGQPEFGVASGTHYTVFDAECASTPKPDKCAAPGILWRSKSQDKSSGVTTSTVFDFNCDEKAEVVYRDECWLRVYEGATGKVLFASAMTSNTAIEGAVVADTDASGHAKIVIGTNDIPKCADATEEYTGTPFSGLVRGVFILRDPVDRWSPTRRIWNQNGYHVTNVNEDGTIPAVESPSWITDGAAGNTWRANVILGP